MRSLCRVDDIPEGGAKGLSLTGGGGPGEIFLVRAHGRIRGYVNSCPHIGTPLDVLPDRFLTRDGRQILCSTHGARFEIESGRCVAGPCRGRFLQALRLKVEDGVILLLDETQNG